MLIESQILLKVVASALKNARIIDRFSSGFTFFGGVLFVGLMFNSCPEKQVMGACLGLSIGLIVLGSIQKYWAFRTAFDAELFTFMASDPSPENTDRFDQAMQHLSLRSVPVSRISWELRGQGALSLLRKQILCVVAQLILLLIFAGVLYFAPRFVGVLC